MNNLRLRKGVVLLSILFALYLLIPTYLKFFHGIQVSKVSKASDPWYFSTLPSETLKLGLDLMGGLHFVMGIDFNEVKKDSLYKLKDQFKELLQNEKIEGIDFDVIQDSVIAKYTSEDSWKKADSIISKYFSNTIDFVSTNSNQAQIKISALQENEIRKRAVDQSLETLRNRIDEFGIAEPILQRQGDEKILIQFPGEQQPERLKEIISRTAKLGFYIVRTSSEEPQGALSNGGSDQPINLDNLKKLVSDFEDKKKIKIGLKTTYSAYLNELNNYAQESKKIPSSSIIKFHKETNINTKETIYIPYLLDREAVISGDELQDAYYTFNPENNQPEVNFQLTPTASSKFEKATGENINRYLAIVLDDNVYNAPRIKSRIPGGRGRIELGGQGKDPQEILNEAKDTSLVLRSGALPAKLSFLEERVIGPSLGLDAIQSGTRSLIFGLLLVFAFMSFYYKKSGVIAVFALSLNGLFVLALMAAFEGTLTLPGLAGLTLTLGMAVDANILIFEQMREQLRLGKAPLASITEGYSKAFSAILDGNLTSIIAGLILLSFGYGPIRGFAVTLIIGLMASMYTAIFVTRVVFDSLHGLQPKKLISI